MLDIVEEQEPIENEWSLVVFMYNQYTEAQKRSKRDGDSVKGKFYSLYNTKKPTGNPSCPPFFPVLSTLPGTYPENYMLSASVMRPLMKMIRRTFLTFCIALHVERTMCLSTYKLKELIDVKRTQAL